MNTLLEIIRTAGIIYAHNKLAAVNIATRVTMNVLREKLGLPPEQDLIMIPFGTASEYEHPNR